MACLQVQVEVAGSEGRINMGRTIAEKILSTHTNDPVEPGAFISARVDMLMLNDGSGPYAIKILGEMGATQVFDPERIVLVSDHNAPAKDDISARSIRTLQNFAQSQGIVHHYGPGSGIAHLIMAEGGIALPGELIVGGDSHTCLLGGLGAFATGMGATDLAYCLALGEVWLRVPESVKLIYRGNLPTWVSGKDLILYTIGRFGTDGFRYQALELSGPVISELSVSQRETMCNMGVEAGAKVAIVPADQKTVDYTLARAARSFVPVTSDSDAEYAAIIEMDVDNLEPQISCPSSPGNVQAVDSVRGIHLDQVYIGSCTNTKIDDLRVVAQILRGRKVFPETRLIVIPGTRQIQLQAVREGLIETFLDAGATVGPPTCGACFGGHMGLLAPNEVCLTTTNRNFPGRMGAIDAQIYLASPAVAAASAVRGCISHPRDVVRSGEETRI